MWIQSIHMYGSCPPFFSRFRGGKFVSTFVDTNTTMNRPFGLGLPSEKRKWGAVLYASVDPPKKRPNGANCKISNELPFISKISIGYKWLIFK